MDREELSALVGGVREIAAAVQRIEDRLEHMDGNQARIAADLGEFRSETRAQLAKIGCRLDHHDRRIDELEDTHADT